MESVVKTPVEAQAMEVRRNFRWNYAMHALDGGLFIGGVAFVDPSTVLPKVIESLGGPAWLISLMPIAMLAGFVLPSLLIAHWVESMPIVKPIILLSGVFQRIPYLAAALVLFWWAQDYPLLALSAVALAPLVSGFFGGITLTAWLELVAKTIPENRRSSVWAIRFILSSSIGIVAGRVIANVLDKQPGADGYGILHLIALAFLILSYIFFFMIRETNGIAAPTENHTGLLENLRSVPGLIRYDRRLLQYLITRSLMNGIFVMTPFLAIHGLRVLDLPESYLGHFVTAQMFGGIFGNLMAGYLGDRSGGKIVMMVSRSLFLGLSVWACLAATEGAFLCIFFLYGGAFFCNQVGTTTLCIEICPSEKRATYLAIMATITLPSALLASGLSTLIWTWTESFPFLAAVTAVSMVFSMMYLAKIEEPRQMGQV